MPTYTCLNGITIEYAEPSSKVEAFIERVRAMAADPAVRWEETLNVVSSPENPILEKTHVPGRAMVTRAVLDNPVYHVLHDLVGVKQVNLGLVDLEATVADYTMSVADAAKQLGLTPAAVRAAINSYKLDAWMRDGQWFIHPDSVALYKPSSRGRSNLGRKDSPVGDSSAATVSNRRPGSPAVRRTRKQS